MSKLQDYLDIAVTAAIEAGEKTIKYYKDDLDVLLKDDHSPLTQADLESNEVINYYLNKTELPLLSEENRITPYSIRSEWTNYWLVDPLDGTKEFINKRSDYTVNIALIERNQPLMGIVFAPAKSVLYYGLKGLGSYKVKTDNYSDSKTLLKNAKKINSGKIHKKLIVVASKSHLSVETKEYISKLEKAAGKCEISSYGSSLKLCMVAEGSADIYPRLGPTMEWDTAASHAVAEFADCFVLGLPDKKPVVYNKQDLLNPWFVVYNQKLDSLVRRIT